MQRRLAAEAVLQSVILLARWACELLQGGTDMQLVAKEQGITAVVLLSMAASTEGGGSGSSRSSLCAAAVAAASWQQVQRCAATLAAALAAAAAGPASVSAVQKLGAVARLLLCLSGGNGIGPVTLGCLRSRQGREHFHTRLVVPAKLLATVVDWFGNHFKGALSGVPQVKCQQDSFS
jgi:hypothetical protein